MRRQELAHILRAAARIVGDPASWSSDLRLLGSYWEHELPEVAWLSAEADLAFLDDPDADKADQVDGLIGELSDFHRTYTYYAQGVEVSTAVLPAGWHGRVVSFDGEAAHPATAVCLEPHDLVVSKLVARRAKNHAFAAALIAAQLVHLPTLLDRAALLPDEHAFDRAAVIDWLQATADRFGISC